MYWNYNDASLFFLKKKSVLFLIILKKKIHKIDLLILKFSPMYLYILYIPIIFTFIFTPTIEPI